MAVRSSRRRSQRRKEEQDRENERMQGRDVQCQHALIESTQQDAAGLPDTSVETSPDIPDIEYTLDLLFQSNPDDSTTPPAHTQNKTLTAPPLTIISTSTSSPAQDPSKRNFFDLPPELRLEIYTLICTTWLKDSAPVLSDTTSTNKNTKTIILADVAIRKKWGTYAHNLTSLQAISAQFRREFTIVWAETTTFRLVVPDFPFARKDGVSKRHPYAQNCGTSLLKFLRGVGSDVSRHTREVQIVCTFGMWSWHVPGYNAQHEAWHEWARAQAASPALGVGRLLEGCEDVHPEMVLMVAFRCVDEGCSWRRKAEVEAAMSFRQGVQGWYALDVGR